MSDVFSDFLNWCREQKYVVDTVQNTEQNPFWITITFPQSEMRIGVRARDEEFIGFKLYVEFKKNRNEDLPHFFLPLNMKDDCGSWYNVYNAQLLIKQWESLERQNYALNADLNYLDASLPLFRWAREQKFEYAALLPNDTCVDDGDFEIFHITKPNYRIIVRCYDHTFSAFENNVTNFFKSYDIQNENLTSVVVFVCHCFPDILGKYYKDHFNRVQNL